MVFGEGLGRKSIEAKFKKKRKKTQREFELYWEILKM